MQERSRKEKMMYTRVKHSRQENRYKNKKNSPIPLNLKKMSNFACHKNKNSYGNLRRRSFQNFW